VPLDRKTVHGRPGGLRPRRCGAWPLTGRCSVRDGGSRTCRAVASGPRPGPTPGCYIRDDEDGVGSVAAVGPVSGRRSRVRGNEPAPGAPGPSPPLRFWLEASPHVHGVLAHGGLPFAVLPGVGGFLRDGTLCGGACFALPLWRRARGAAQWPPCRCSAVLHLRCRAVARDRCGPLLGPLFAPFSSSSGADAGGAPPRSRAESVESEHAVTGNGPLV
jgi:hypothetical protein